MKKNMKNNCYLFLILMYLLIFQEIITKWLDIFQYFDEFLALLMIPITVLDIKNNNYKICKKDFDYFILMMLLFVVGIFSNISYKYQDISVVLKDVILIFKFFMVVYLSKVLINNQVFSFNKKFIMSHMKILVYVFFILTILNYIFKIWPSDIRFGIMSNRLFYGHPTNLAALLMFIFSIVELCGVNKNKLVKILILLMLLSTLRAKAIAAVGVILIFLEYTYLSKNKINILKILMIGLAAIVIGFNQIKFYFFEVDESARRKLFDKSLEIMTDYFPIGTGFATYASHFSGKYYSPVYSMYNLSYVEGISKDNFAFVSDSFWPMIFGQFGFIGTILYCFLLLYVYKEIQNSFDKENLSLYNSKMICFLYLLISSTAESAFVHPISVPLALIIGISNKNQDS